MLRGTIRDHVTQQRRPFVRFFACEEDLSHESPDAPLPDAVATGAEPFLLVGAIARGAGRRDRHHHVVSIRTPAALKLHHRPHAAWPST